MKQSNNKKSKKSRKFDGGEYCLHCRLRVPLSSDVRLTRTVPVTAQTPSGRQSVHIACLDSDRFFAAYVTYGPLIGQTLPFSAFKERHRRRGPLLSFVEMLREARDALRDRPDAVAAWGQICKSAADLLHTDRLDFTLKSNK